MRTLYSGCKINLFLDITGTRGNYHTLSTLFLPLAAPSDILRIHPDTGNSAGLSVRFIYADKHAAANPINPFSNTLTKAYALYREATGFCPSLHVEVEKHVPSGGGLGGGSANAAALLQELQALAPQPLPEMELFALATKAGADVPFFLRHTPCLAGGIGDELTPLPPEACAALSSCTLLLLCPHFPISTPWAYQAFDVQEKSLAFLPADQTCSTTTPFSTLSKSALIAEKNFLKFFMEKCLTSGPLMDKSHDSCSGIFFVRNALEPVAFAAHPVLGYWKTRLFQEGAFAAGMSGSGSSLFGLFRNSKTAENAASSLREENANVHEAGVSAGNTFQVWTALLEF